MIQTVTGKINNIAMGKSLVHEHISCTSNNLLSAFRKDWLDREYLKEYATEILKVAKEKYSLNLLVDGTPIDLGRDADLLKEISQKSGVNIVASTGFYFFHDFGINGITHTELADFLIKECENGMDGTDVKPGILKCAASSNGFSQEIIKKHACIGIVQKETGLPIYVHCEHKDNDVFEQIDVLQKHGADIEKIIIGHCARRPDFDYLKQVLKMGCYVSVDQSFCFPNDLAYIADFVIKACEWGYTGKLLVSNDYCIHSDFELRHRNGFHLNIMEQVQKLGHVFDLLNDEFVLNGGKAEDWETIITQNTSNVLDVL